STIGFFAPAASLAGGCPSAELKSLVRALHKNKIELWLDVVFNHTGRTGGRLLFEGAGDYYYDPPLANISGCGNTVRCSAPGPARFILDALEYWRREYRIDGFRFDLCSVLCRDDRGEIAPEPPLIKAIGESPLLRGCKLIAEPWDAAGGYMAGSFGKTGRWSEWNGRYRDALRRFLTGQDNAAEEMAKCIEGSPHLFPRPEASVNFVTCHDGFTLYDLFAYSQKHNLANGENGRDGTDANYSCNMGTEGPSSDPAVEKRRRTFALNALAILMFSKGVPMVLMGDELLRTKQGNNNTYCQDNPLSWLCWDLTDEQRDMLRAVRELIALRKVWGPPPGSAFTWHGTQPEKPDFSWTSHTLAWEYGVVPSGANGRSKKVYAAANMFSRPLAFTLPPGSWRLLFSTSGEPCGGKYGTIALKPGTVCILTKEL
ncbi:MAG: glycogen debranching enzyme, partial [Abditibacteriota bacterium]|nr:glycogen debranching enzyme [Abditibacteriota bacterium]